MWRMAQHTGGATPTGSHVSHATIMKMVPSPACSYASEREVRSAHHQRRHAAVPSTRAQSADSSVLRTSGPRERPVIMPIQCTSNTDSVRLPPNARKAMHISMHDATRAGRLPRPRVTQEDGRPCCASQRAAANLSSATLHSARASVKTRLTTSATARCGTSG